MPETILLPLLGLSLWATFRAIKDQSSSNKALAWSLWMVTCLAKVVALPASLVAGLWMIVGNNGSKWKPIALFACISAILLIPIAYQINKTLNIASPFGFPELNRIYFESGEKRIKANFTKNKGTLKWHYIFQSPSIDSKALAPLSNWTTTRSQASDVEINVNLDKGLGDWLIESDKNHRDVDTHIRMLIENAIVIIFDRSWPDETSRKFLFIYHEWLRFVWAPLLVSVLAGNTVYLYKRRRLELLPTLVTVTLFFFFFLPAAVGEGRYRKPLEGLLIANALWLATRRKENQLIKPQ